MYIQGESDYDYHVKTYGHPSKFGFMEIDNLWKAENWEPGEADGLYKRAGAKYFFALANHHDNFDSYDSKLPRLELGQRRAEEGHRRHLGQGRARAWPALRRHQSLLAGPGTGCSPPTATTAKARWPASATTPTRSPRPTARASGGRASTRRTSTPATVVVMPDGLTTIAAVRAWHNAKTQPGQEQPHAAAELLRELVLRCQDLVDKYQPDLLYFDNNELPLGQAGLDVVAHYYNPSAARNGGRADVVVNGKHIEPDHVGAFVEDIERGKANAIRPDPWQTDTCIGDWHYSRPSAEQNRYKTVATIVAMLIDIVSKNGNLMLNIPLRGDGTIDEHEVAFLAGLTAWMDVNSRGHLRHAARGRPTAKALPPRPALRARRPRCGGGLYVAGHPLHHQGRDALRLCRRLAGVARRANQEPRDRIAAVGRCKVKDVSLLGYGGKLNWTQDEQGLSVNLPDKPPSQYAVTLKIQGLPTK